MIQLPRQNKLGRKILALLDDGIERSTSEIAAALGRHPSNISRSAKNLMALGLIYRSRWPLRGGGHGHPEQHFTIGPGRNVRREKPDDEYNRERHRNNQAKHAALRRMKRRAAEMGPFASIGVQVMKGAARRAQA